MNWIKSPLAWQFWGGSTLLASLSIHGLLLSLPVDAKKETPKPETLAAVPIIALPAEATATSSPKLSEPEPTVTSPPQPDEPSVEESEPLFDRFPSQNWSSFPDRVESFPKQLKEPEEPVEEIETVEETEEDRSDLKNSSERPEIHSTDVETQDENRQDETIPDRTLESQPSIDPRKKILLTSTQPSSSSGDSDEREDIDRTFSKGNENVETLFASLEKDEKGQLSSGEKAIMELLLPYDILPNISTLKSLFFEQNKLTQLKPEIDKKQSLFILSSTESPININKLHEYYITPLESQGFNVKEEPDTSEGKIYRVEKIGIGFVRYIQLYETEVLEGQLLAGVIVWKELPGQ